MGACTDELDARGNCIQRLELQGDDLTEWWVGLGIGLEQGWTVQSSPGGPGLLVFEIAVEGALALEADGAGATIIDARGGTWWVDGVAAWDANGKALPAWLDVDGEGLRVEVDDAGAVYPIEVDPVYTTASATWTGEASGNAFGMAVGGADVNGDGYSDVIVGASNYSSQMGRVYVYNGSSSGVATVASTTLTGATTGLEFGQTLSRAGDVNNDGYDDVIIGARQYAGNTGRAYVYHGSASGLTTAATTLSGPGSGSYFGGSLSGAGDVNGDGYDDVVVGAFNASSGQGRAYVYLGSASGVSTSASTTFAGATGDYLGQSVAGAGDVNGDGYDDVIVGANAYNGYQGRAYIYLGSSTGPSASAARTLSGSGNNVQYGFTVAGAGDVNGDGYDDVIVGEFQGAPAGRASSYHGSATGTSATANGTLTGQNAGDAYAYRVTGLGDVNGDGYDDVGVGSYNYGSVAGRAYVYEGSASGIVTGSTATFTGTAANAQNWMIGAAGDVNGDNATDVVVGALGASGGGSASLFLGYALDGDGDGYVGVNDCDDSDPSVHATVSGYVDGDGDGFGDTTVVSYCPGAGAGGYASVDGDCDDSSSAIHPGATDTCGDLVDQDCDGVGASDEDDEDGDGVIASLERSEGGDDCVADDDGDGLLVEGRGDADYDGVPDYLDAVADAFAVVNADAAWTNARAVRISYSPPAGTNQVCSANSSTGTCTFASFRANTKTHTLTAGAGTKTVTIKFRNSLSPSRVTTMTDTIGLDTTKPTNGTVTATAATGEVTLNWSGFSDAESGLAAENTYKVVYARSATAPTTCATGTVASAGTTATSLTVTGLIDASLYSFRVCAFDAAGNRSTGSTASETPGADQTAPTGTVMISGDATYSTSTTVTLTLDATDDTGVATMCASNTSACTSFVTYARTKRHTLTAGAGTRTVYVYFKDRNGNISTAATDTIELDTTPPSNGAVTATATTGEVTLDWSGFSDAGSGLAATDTYKVVYARAATAPSNCATGTVGTSGTTATSLTIAGLIDASLYSFRVCAFDTAGNRSTGSTASETPGADQTAPTGTVVIDGDATYTASRTVALTLDAADDTGVTTMCSSNSSTCTSYVAYSTSRTHTLPTGSGTKTVYVTYKDANGNVSSAATATIVLDMTRPTDVGTLGGTAASSAVDLSWTAATDALSGVASYRVAYKAGATAPTTCTAGTGVTLLTGLTGTNTTVSGLAAATRYSFRECAVDAVGNVSAGKTKTVTTL